MLPCGVVTPCPERVATFDGEARFVSKFGGWRAGNDFQGLNRIGGGIWFESTLLC
jgi:hypothetical protein